MLAYVTIVSVVTPNYLTSAEAGQRLGVSPRTIRRWVDAGRLAGFTMPSGTYRVSVAAVESIERAHAEPDSEVVA